MSSLLKVTAECVRVLKPSGSLWVNLGDKYDKRTLLLIPQRYAIRCMDDLGLTVRSEVIWNKPNPYIDAKASDRFRRTHETWFHLSPSRKPYASTGALAVTSAADYTERPQYRRAQELFAEHGFTDAHREAVRAVGNIDTQGSKVRSGGSWDSEAGRLAREVSEALGSYYRELCGTPNRPQMPGSVRSLAAYSLKPPKSLGLVGHFASFPLEWPAWLVMGWCPEGGTVLDPFGGTGTTAMVAKALGRHGISVDMSADYCRLAEWRVNDPAQLAKVLGVAKADPVHPDETSLLDLLDGSVA